MIGQISKAPASKSVLDWVGSSMRYLVCLLLLLSFVVVPGLAETSDEATAEIRISIPDGDMSNVSVEPGEDGVVLDLPRGSRYPSDFVASSHGMLRDGKIEFSEELLGSCLQPDRLEATLPRCAPSLFLVPIDQLSQFG